MEPEDQTPPETEEDRRCQQLLQFAEQHTFPNRIPKPGELIKLIYFDPNDSIKLIDSTVLCRGLTNIEDKNIWISVSFFQWGYHYFGNKDTAIFVYDIKKYRWYHCDRDYDNTRSNRGHANGVAVLITRSGLIQ